MATLESGLLLMLYARLFIENTPPAVLIFEHISTWHHQWLGNVYDWAGRATYANLTKTAFSLPLPTEFRYCLMVSGSSFSPSLVK